MRRSNKAITVPENVTRFKAKIIGRKGPVFRVENRENPNPDQPFVINCIARGHTKKAVVGDYVEYILENSDWAEGLIIHLEPRKNELVRVDPVGKKPQVLAANLDRLWVVCAAYPLFKNGLIDRYLVAAHQQNISAGIIFNKIDLIRTTEIRDFVQDSLKHYPKAGYPVYWASAHREMGLDLLKEELKGKTSVFVGHSGVGKTSLMNALIPGLDEDVQEVSEATGRGKHTTTSSTLYHLPSGGDVIDSPGIRGFGLWGVQAGDLKNHFVEFLPLQSACKFQNCLHLSEPGCAVKEAVRLEKIAKLRYDAYTKIHGSLLDEEG
jgi:ribosome biogenesis GTPase